MLGRGRGHGRDRRRGVREHVEKHLHDDVGGLLDHEVARPRHGDHGGVGAEVAHDALPDRDGQDGVPGAPQHQRPLDLHPRDALGPGPGQRGGQPWPGGGAVVAQHRADTVPGRVGRGVLRPALRIQDAVGPPAGGQHQVDDAPAAQAEQELRGGRQGEEGDVRRAQQRHLAIRRVGDDEPPHEVRPRAGQAEGQRAAPVVTDDVHATTGDLDIDQRRELRDDRARIERAGVGGPTEPRQVRGKDAPPRGQRRRDLPPAGGRLGDAVQQQDGRAADRRRAGLLAEQETGLVGADDPYGLDTHRGTLIGGRSSGGPHA